MIHHDDKITLGNPLEIFGNDRLLARLTHDIRDSRLSHAYILDGKPGSGRHTIALHMAAAIACYHRPGRLSHGVNEPQMGFFDDEPAVAPMGDGSLPCGVCDGCRKVLAGISPDVILIGREGKATLGVDAVRRVKETVHLAPGETDIKVYIIEDAETMTPQAQNALLLTLEEPPAYVLFILLCNGAENLLETIRSRAPVLHTSPVSDELIKKSLSAHKRSLPAAELDALLICADGSIGQALALSDARSLKSILKQRELTDAFIEGTAHKRKASIPAVIGQFGNKRDEVLSLLSLLTLAVRDLMLLKKSETAKLKYYTERDTALALTEVLTSRALLTLYQALEQARDELMRNGNVRLTLTQMCFAAGVL